MSTDNTDSTPGALDQQIEREISDLRDRGIIEKEAPTITRSTYHRLTPKEQSEFFRAGGKVTDDPAPERKPLPAGAIRRSTYDAMSAPDRAAFFKKGGVLVDDEFVVAPPAALSTTITRSAFRDLKMSEQIAFLDSGGTVTD